MKPTESFAGSYATDEGTAISCTFSINGSTSGSAGSARIGLTCRNQIDNQNHNLIIELNGE